MDRDPIIKNGSFWEYKGVEYFVVPNPTFVDIQIQYDDVWGPAVFYMTEGVDSVFVRNEIEFLRKFTWLR